jgi:hypothetical protein
VLAAPRALMAIELEVSVALHNVCFWHKADIQLSPGNVRFWGKADITV